MRQKTGGRQKGTPNKSKQALLNAIQDRFPGYHPVMAMVEIAHDEQLSKEVRFQAHKEVAQYVEPKRKAIEVEGSLETDVSIRSITVNGVEPKHS